MTVSTRRFREKREAILDAAARHFNQHGIRGGTLAGIGRDVGLATNSLTYYYAKKEDLASACLLRSIEAMNTLCADAARLPDAASRVRCFIAGYVGMLSAIERGDHPEMVVFNEVRSLAAPHAATVHAAYVDMFRRVRALLASTPALARQASNARAHLLLSLVTWTRVWIGRYEAQDYALAGERIADIVVRGLAAPNARWEPWLPEAIDLPAATGPISDAFLRAATREVNEQGYRGASVDRISAKLHLTKGAFYHHHDAKHDLIAACFERTFAAMRAVQAAAGALPGTGWQRLHRAGCGLVAYQLSDQGPLLRVTAWSALPETMRHDMLRTMTRVGERFGAFVVDGMADGSLRICDPSVAAQLVNGMVNAAAELEHWVPGLTRDNATRLFVAPLLHGLLSAPVAAMEPVAPRPAQPRIAGSV